MSRVLTILPGRTYEPPPSQDKLEPQHASVNDLLRAAVPRTNDRPLARQSLPAVSPALAREVAHRAGLGPLMPVHELQTEDSARIVDALAGLHRGFRDWSPMTLCCPAGRGSRSDPPAYGRHRGHVGVAPAFDVAGGRSGASPHHNPTGDVGAARATRASG
jgi:predicted ribosome quality control (RQC) complex YloA/Tae2 family protein